MRSARPLLLLALAVCAFAPRASHAELTKATVSTEVTLSNLTEHAVELRFTGQMCTLRALTEYQLVAPEAKAGLRLSHYVYSLPTSTPEQDLFGGSKEEAEIAPALPLPPPEMKCAEAEGGCATKSLVDLGDASVSNVKSVRVARSEAIGLADRTVKVATGHVLVGPSEDSGSDAPRVRAACPFVRIDPDTRDVQIELRKVSRGKEPELAEGKATIAGVLVDEDRHMVVTNRGEGRIDVYVQPVEKRVENVTLMGRRSRQCLSRRGGQVAVVDCKKASRLDVVPVEGTPARVMIRDRKGKRCLTLPSTRRGPGGFSWSRCKAGSVAQHWRLLDGVNEAKTQIASMYDHVRSDAAGVCLFSRKGKGLTHDTCEPTNANEQWKLVK